MPGLDLNQPINWDEIGEFEGDVHDLTYDYVWDSGNEAAADDDDDDGNTAADGEDEAARGDVVVEPEAGSGAHTVQQAQGAPSMQQAYAGDEADAGDEDDVVAFDSGTPANIKRRRYYPPDIKRILYAMCLERSAPSMMKEGVTKSVANDMGVCH
ncbi:unnamed protein product [Urochloa decumbens]|uniref:Uncharacterized protein n=1 Tax=Urochloa decumbens TaxID=240449 RepID=A0ABC9BUF7_9POAL